MTEEGCEAATVAAVDDSGNIANMEEGPVGSVADELEESQAAKPKRKVDPQDSETPLDLIDAPQPALQQLLQEPEEDEETQLCKLAAADSARETETENKLKEEIEKTVGAASSIGGEEEEKEESVKYDNTSGQLEITGSLSQAALEALAKKYPNLKSIKIDLEYEDETPRLDFSKINLPEVTLIDLDCCPIISFNFKKEQFPKLENISVKTQGVYAANEFDIDLPELRYFDMEFVEIEDSSEFGPSLSRSPKLERFSSYKFWGLGSFDDTHRLILPNCRTFDIHWSDDVERISLWAPKLTYLNLRACFGLDYVRLLNKIPTSVPKELRSRPLKDSLVVNVINANIDSRSYMLLQASDQVKEFETDEEEGGMQTESMFQHMQSFDHVWFSILSS